MGFTKSLRGFRKRKRQSQNHCLVWFNAQPDYWSVHFCWIHHYSKNLSGCAKTLRCSSIRRVSAEGCVSARRYPPHWGLIVRDFLNETFPNRWIGRNGPTPWPPRSPDITLLDFLLWVYVKDRVYRTPVRDVETLQSRIIEVLATVNDEMLENTWREIEYRLDILRATNGAHVEVYE